MKIIGIVLALGTAIIVGGLINLGISAFHPGPPMLDYAAFSTKPAPYYDYPCEKGDKECVAAREARFAEEQKRQEEQQAKQKEYDDKMKVYNRDVFLIANVAGIVVFIAGFLILFGTAIVSQGVPIGVMIAGMYGIIYGYARGWGSTDDRLKFFVGLAVAALVIGGSIWLMQRYAKRHNR